MKIYLFILLLTINSFSNPYFDPTKVKEFKFFKSQQNKPYWSEKNQTLLQSTKNEFDVLRVQVGVDLKTEKYFIKGLYKEKSGTLALQKRLPKQSPLGSYKAHLKNIDGSINYFDSIGTGKEFRLLTDSITFRFPYNIDLNLLEITAENPKTGKMEVVLTAEVSNSEIQQIQTENIDAEIRNIKTQEVTNQTPIVLNIYSEGYSEDQKNYFFEAANKIPEILTASNFPYNERFEINAIFSKSNLKLGEAKELGLPVQERDSFLGLYFPYWNKFGRWFNVIYPTREEKLRKIFSIKPYDYAVVIADSKLWWGVGNFKEFTAIPSDSSNFTYLFLHEFGHFFGLNEEYSGGGRTELEFAPKIEEPWSQNITFLNNPVLEYLKWAQYVTPNTPLPTPIDIWTAHPPRFGAYKGGYADSDSKHSHTPGKNCVMDRYENYCEICKNAIRDVIKYDLGE